MHNLKNKRRRSTPTKSTALLPRKNWNSPAAAAHAELGVEVSGKLKKLETRLAGKKELQRQVLAFAKTKPVRDGAESPEVREKPAQLTGRHTKANLS